jgi:hypothetical protein
MSVFFRLAASAIAIALVLWLIVKDTERSEIESNRRYHNYVACSNASLASRIPVSCADLLPAGFN